MLEVAGVVVSLSLIIAWLEISKLQGQVEKLNGRLMTLEMGK